MAVDTKTTDLISEFVEDMRAYGKSESTLYEYERILRDFDKYLNKHHSDATRKDCMQYISSLRESELSQSTIAVYASYLHRFYSYLVKAEEYPHNTNPMGLVVEEMSESINKNPRRRELSVEDVRGFLKTVNHPRDRCMILTLFKTGMRAGEIANLDLKHVSLDPDTNDEFGLGKDALVNPMSILVSSDIEGNKRVRDTLIPIDPELRQELLRWLRVRPKRNDPFFVSLSPASNGRLSPEAISSMMRKYTREYGWWSENADLRQNVTPHYCRHFFTTYMRDKSGDDAFVKYLRGDVGGDVIDTYTHQWGDKVREKYLENIYSLLP